MNTRSGKPGSIKGMSSDALVAASTIIRQCSSYPKAKVFRYMAKNIPWDRYREVTPDVPDTVYQNREDPEKHRFGAPLKSPVVLYGRMK